MTLEWTKLRTFDGDQRKAFEELVCQLAMSEQQQSSAKFIRVGAPDAGVEGYWQYANNEEWGFQAKFFRDTPGKVQWEQIDKSVKTAIEKHPKLTKYTICLPIDRTNPRIEEKQCFMDKWNKRVEKWKKLASEKKMKVEFDYWGNSEIFYRLSLDNHRGRRYFWFNQEQLHDVWFKEKFGKAIANIGPRYTPEIHVNVPEAEPFLGLCHDIEFYNKFKTLAANVIGLSNGLNIPEELSTAHGIQQQIARKAGELSCVMPINDEYGIQAIPSQEIIKIIDDTLSLSKSCRDALRDAANLNKAQYKIDQTKAVIKHFVSSPTPEDYSRHTDAVYKLEGELNAYSNFCKSPTVKAAESGALVLLGHAGTGKSHLFCDIAKGRVEKGLPTILLLGQYFVNSEPWNQIKHLLELSVQNSDELLGALDSAAQARRCKALILIDALNEGEGKSLWPSHINGFLKDISKFPRIVVAISVRSSYEEFFFPQGYDFSSLPRIYHKGFEGVEFNAMTTFFHYYKIELPSTPYFQPEFTNPFFLNIFCKGLQLRGHNKVPKGIKGITAVFDMYINEINRKLSRVENLDYDELSNYVKKAVDGFANYMANNNTYFLPYEKAHEIATSLLQGQTGEKGLLKNLIHEGIVNMDMHYSFDTDTSSEVVRFAFERFADHKVASILLARHDKALPKSFSESGPLGKYLLEPYRYQGIVEAFSIQLPEIKGEELVDIAPYVRGDSAVAKAFIESLVWRSPNAFTESSLKYLNELYRDDHLRGEILRVFLTVATDPEHKLNAMTLHKYLSDCKMPDRDYLWSTFLHEEYTDEDLNAVSRIINWAWSTDDRSYVGRDSLLLAGITLSWFFTSSNRFIRDRSTKALVSLYTSHIDLYNELIPMFLKVDDVYVLERIFASAFGSVTRSKDHQNVEMLARNVYKWIFASGNPIPHILLRDYARGIIDYALQIGIKLDVDLSKTRPPYGSKWPAKLPSIGELEKKYESDGYSDIYRSVYEWGDFSRYVIGTNSNMFPWSPERLSKTKKPKKTNLKFDLSLVQRFILDKVLHLGWKAELFRDFDRTIGRFDLGREAHKPERIGKKYQWIAYHEALACIADTFERVSGLSYDGSWSPYERDIDPTSTVKQKPKHSNESAWWIPTKKVNFRSDISDKMWLNNTADLPDPGELIEVTDSNGNIYLNLNMYISWDQELPIGQKKFAYPSRNIYYIMNSYLVREQDMKKASAWVKQQNFYGRWMPEAREEYATFLREYPWRGISVAQNIEYDLVQEKTMPCKLIITNYLHLKESQTLDCSIDDSFSINLLSKWIIDKWGLIQTKNDGEFLDAKGNRVSFDPSVFASGPTALLVDKNLFMQFLQNNKLGVIWTVLGEKIVYETKLGITELSGGYAMTNGKIKGRLKRYIRK